MLPDSDVEAALVNVRRADCLHLLSSLFRLGSSPGLDTGPGRSVYTAEIKRLQVPLLPPQRVSQQHIRGEREGSPDFPDQDLRLRVFSGQTP